MDGTGVPNLGVDSIAPVARAFTGAKIQTQAGFAVDRKPRRVTALFAMPAAVTTRLVRAPIPGVPAPTRIRRPRVLRLASTRVASASSTADPASALGVEYPASAPGEGVRGRGLFHTGDAPDVPVVRTPIDVTLCVPELVGPDAPAECADGVRAMYKAWSASLDVDVPEPIVDFLCHAECPKDLRMAAALMWARRHVPRWRAYADDVMPASYTSLYLATDEELEALQDENVRRMAMGSKANYAAGWEMIKTQHPRVADAIDGSVDDQIAATQEEFDWARATAHTRAMSGKVAGGPCAFIVPGVDLANHSFAPNCEYGVSGDGGSFQLTWDTTATREMPKGPPLPESGDEVLICYGARMPNALLMLHYGFMDPENPNEQLPMECMIPGARKIRAKTVSAAGRAFAEEGDTKAEWAARQMMQMANPVDDSADKAADLACIGAMRGAADAKLASFPTTAEEDEVALSAGELGERMRMCVEYRLSVKRNVEAFGRFLAKMEEVVE